MPNTIQLHIKSKTITKTSLTPCHINPFSNMQSWNAIRQWSHTPNTPNLITTNFMPLKFKMSKIFL